MSTNSYFNQMGNPETQNFINGLIIQAIKASGLDMLYVQRSVLVNDDTFEEAKHELFANAVEIEFMVESIMNFNGEGHNFLVGFTMEDSAVFVVNQSRFKTETGMDRPSSGDLIYIKSVQMVFQVDKVLEDETWKEWGQNYVWRLKMSRFRFGHEEFDTGELDLDDDLEGVLDSNVDTETGDIFPYEDTAGEASNVESQLPDIDIDFGD